MKRPSIYQLRAFIRRMTMQEPQPTINRGLAEGMFKFEPPTTRITTQLDEKIPLPGSQGPTAYLSPDQYHVESRIMSPEEALPKYLENPEKYLPPGRRGTFTASEPTAGKPPYPEFRQLVDMVGQRGYAREAAERWREKMSFPLSVYTNNPTPETVPPWLDKLVARPEMDYRSALENYIPKRQPPERFGTGPIDRIYKTEVGSPEDIAEGIAYERIQHKPFRLPSGLAKTTNALRGMDATEQLEKGLARHGVAEEDLRVSPAQFLRMKDEPVKVAPIAAMVKQAVEAEGLWKASYKEIGKEWNKLLDKQPSTVRSAYPFAKDYFLYSYRQYMKNPSQMKNKRAGEARLIERMLGIIKEE